MVGRLRCRRLAVGLLWGGRLAVGLLWARLHWPGLAVVGAGGAAVGARGLLRGLAGAVGWGGAVAAVIGAAVGGGGLVDGAGS